MKQKVFDKLDELKLEYKNFEHEPVFTCDEAKGIEVPGKRVKNLLLRNEKKTRFYMVVLEDQKRLDSGVLRKILQESKLSFATRELMIEKIGVEPGHVSPFALLNNISKDIRVIFDKELDGELAGFHPLQNDNTTVINTKDIEKFLQELGIEFEYLEI